MTSIPNIKPRNGAPDRHVIGLISDTHGQVRTGVRPALEGADLILHAGDVGREEVLDELRNIAPVKAVHGNTDADDDPQLPPAVTLEIGGLMIHVSHGHEVGVPTPAKLLAIYAADVIVYGHTHRALVMRNGTRLVVNPGAAGPPRFNLRPSVAVLTIVEGEAEVEIVEIE